MRKFLNILLIVMLVLFLLGFAALNIIWAKFADPFFTAAGVSPQRVFSLTIDGLKRQPQQTDGRKNFLILGTDEVEGRNSPGVLTDSMIVFSLNLNTGKGTLIPIPRDLWLKDEETKINAMYYYGRKTFPDSPEKLPAEVVERITGLPIHHVVLLNLSLVGQVIDTLGGVDVQVERSFTDALFPKSGVDVTKVRDPNLLYETVSFQKGLQHMDGEMALKFMRSRHSTDPEERTDDARSRRQQLVISSVIGKVKQELLRGKTAMLGKLFSVYLNSKLSSEVQFEELVAMAKTMRKSAFSFSLEQFDILPYLQHPPVSKFKQWVYEPIDPTWYELQAGIRNRLSGTISQ